MASAVLSSVPTTASRFALLQVDSGSGSDSEPGKGKGRNTGKSQTNKSTTNEKKREKRRKKKEQQQSEANEVAIIIISCLLSQQIVSMKRTVTILLIHVSTVLGPQVLGNYYYNVYINI